jgi:adenylylsulfate kinase-like enzyme
MFKRTANLAALFVVTGNLSACMYYANFDRQRADTEQTRQKTALIEAYATCIKANVAEPERCPKPNY